MGLFDKLQEGVVKGLGQTERALELSRLKSQMDVVGRQRDEAIMGLGRAVYRAYRENRFSDPEFSGAIDQIRKMEVDLGKLEGEVEALRAQSYKHICPACGAASASDAKFCIGCGRTIEHAETRPCPSCGAAVGVDASFCGRCGTGMEPLVPAAPAVEAPPAEPEPAPASAIEAEPAPTPVPAIDAEPAPAPMPDPGSEPEAGTGIAPGPVCTSCGHLGEPDERFCGACGSAMGS